MTQVMPYLFPVMIAITVGNTVAAVRSKLRARSARKAEAARIETYDGRLSYLERRMFGRVER